MLIDFHVPRTKLRSKYTYSTVFCKNNGIPCSLTCNVRNVFMKLHVSEVNLLLKAM